MKADGTCLRHPSNIPPTSLRTAKKACFSAFPTTSGIEAFLRVKNAREPSKIGRSGCIEGVSFLHSLTLPYNPPEQLKIPRWQHRTGSSPVTGTKPEKSEPNFPNRKRVRIFCLYLITYGKNSVFTELFPFLSVN